MKRKLVAYASTMGVRAGDRRQLRSRLDEVHF